MASDTTTKLHCPRCAYDLSAEARRWNDDAIDEREGLACPLEGTCPECGLRFAWAKLYRPELVEVRWFVEMTEANPRLRKPRFRYVQTWAAALVPWQFWRKISLESPHNVRRRVSWVLGVLFVPALLMLVAITLARGVLDPAASWIGRVTRCALRYDGSPWVLSAVGGFLVYPLVFICLPWTRARSKVTLLHIARATAYSIAPLAALVVVSCSIVLYDTLMMTRWMRSFPWLDPFVSLQWQRQPWLTFGQWLWPLSIAWFALWWGCALRLGFRMSDWRAVLLALAVPAVMTQVLLGFMRAHV
jgi:hypothetical protein